MSYAVYIIYSDKFDMYYIGQTNNVRHRLEEHNSDKAGYTISCQPWILVYEQKFNSRTEAMILEKYLKSFKNKKRIKAYIAGWRSSTSRGS